MASDNSRDIFLFTMLLSDMKLTIMNPAFVTSWNTSRAISHNLVNNLFHCDQ